MPLILALSLDNIFGLLMLAQNLFLPIVVVSMVFTIFGLQIHKNMISIGAISSIISTIAYAII